MPIMDSQLLFAEALDISDLTAYAAVNFTNVIDLGAIKDHKGNSIQHVINAGGQLALNIVVEDTALAGDGSTTVTFSLYDHTTATPWTGGRKLMEFTITVSATNYPDGTQICSLPLPAMKINRYLGVTSLVAAGDLTAGAVTAWIGPVTVQPV